MKQYIFVLTASVIAFGIACSGPKPAGKMLVGDVYASTTLEGEVKPDRYHPFYVTDRDGNTGWCEGMEDDYGNGTTLTVKLKQPVATDTIILQNGYRSYSSDADGYSEKLSKQYYDKNAALSHIKVQATLGDKTVFETPQALALVPVAAPANNENQYTVQAALGKRIIADTFTVTIANYKKGTHYKDTCVTEFSLGLLGENDASKNIPRYPVAFDLGDGIEVNWTEYKDKKLKDDFKYFADLRWYFDIISKPNYSSSSQKVFRYPYTEFAAISGETNSFTTDVIGYFLSAEQNQGEYGFTDSNANAFLINSEAMQHLILKPASVNRTEGLVLDAVKIEDPKTIFGKAKFSIVTKTDELPFKAKELADNQGIPNDWNRVVKTEYYQITKAGEELLSTAYHIIFFAKK